MRVAPPNFGYIEEGIFRCGLPEPRHYSFVASLHLRTCVLLTERVDVTLLRWLNEGGVRVICPLLSVTSATSTAGSAAAAAIASPTAPLPVVLLSHNNGAMYSHVSTAAAAGGGAPSPTTMTMGAAEQQLRALRAAAMDDAMTSPMYTGSHAGGGSSSSYAPWLGNVSATATPAADTTTARGVMLTPAGSDGSVTASAEQMPAVVSVPRFAGATDASSVTTMPVSRTSSSLSLSMRAAAEQQQQQQQQQQQPPPLRLYTTSGNVTVLQQATTTPAAIAAVQQPPPPPSQQPQPPLLYCSTLLYHGGSNNNSSCSAAAVLPAQRTLSEPAVVDILRLLLDPANYPLLLTGSKGRYRTGIVCGCLRKLQRWNVVSILEEYRRYAGDRSRAEDEEFIELFDKDLVSVELDGGRRPTILYEHAV